MLRWDRWLALTSMYMLPARAACSYEMGLTEAGPLERPVVRLMDERGRTEVRPCCACCAVLCLLRGQCVVRLWASAAGPWCAPAVRAVQAAALAGPSSLVCVPHPSISQVNGSLLPLSKQVILVRINPKLASSNMVFRIRPHWRAFYDYLAGVADVAGNRMATAE